MKLKPRLKIILLTIFFILLVPVLMGLDWTRTEDISMAPTVRDGDIVISIDSWSIQPGDIVLFRTPEWEKWPKEDQILCKRIDHVKDGNQYWMLGDNIEESHDSRHFGYVHRTNIYKKVLFIIHR